MSATAIDITTPDGVADAFVAAPDLPGRHPGVIMNMDGVGLRPVLEAMALRLAGHGYVVVVPNAFYRAGRAPLLSMEEIVASQRSPEVQQRLMGLITSITPEAAARDAGAWLAYLDGRPDVRPGPVGTLGYCMGGALAIRTAAAFPARVMAVASLHGGNLATEADTSPHRLLSGLRAEVYVGHADADGSAPPEQQARLAEALSAAGVVHETETYPGSRHGWTMSDLPVYEPSAAERAWGKVVSLFARTLG